ncbi:MAG: alpha-L-fucosidase [Saprospiraceae bacterium]|nr:alpha-L-fucosidase [Saprospiraceae bacterium]
MMRYLFLLFGCFFCQNTFFAQQNSPRPTPAQLTWHDTEFYLFLHFGPNTFTNKEWGHGDEPESVFNPTDLDTDQWCRTAKQAGARGIVITAKHHDGFCLWPSKFSTHTVRESPWKNGQGDVLRELSDACKRHGLKFGVYLSPWDRNHPQYGTPEYNDVYASTLTELLTNYGELFEIWWDGANGEGPNGKKQVYDFHRFEKLAAKLQPNAVIFSDIGPGCRWAGNEQGLILTETNWCMLDTAGFQRGAGGPPVDVLNAGQENGALWLPAECDVSIRPGWFYHAEEDDKVKTPDQLWDIYLRSVGRGANLILNVPPDRRGRIHPNDSLALVRFGEKIRYAFIDNLALGTHAARYLTDGDRETFEVLDFGPSGKGYELDLGTKRTFSTIVLREAIHEGQHVRAFKLEVRTDKGWREIARSNTIGARRILTFPTVTSQKIRITVLDSRQAPKLAEVEVY